jgi:pimeloyl-ACP methyl ester carboxylesterase
MELTEKKTGRIKTGKLYRYSQNIILNYEVEGDGENQIIFLHGISANLRGWEKIRNKFQSENYQQYYIDLKGFGLSLKPRDDKYSMADQAEVIYKFIKDLNIFNPVIVGHSMGGGVALYLYYLSKQNGENDLFKKLILISPSAYPKELKLLYRLSLNRIAVNFPYILPPKFRFRFALKYLFYDKNKVTDELINRYYWFMIGDDARYVHEKVLLQLISPDYEKIISSYSEIDIPVLIIWGKEDPMLKVELAKKLNREIKNSTLKIIQHCGHVPIEETPEEVMRHVRNFLDFRLDF